MGTKKTFLELIIGMALATVLLAAPATASAFTLKDKGQTLEDAEIPLSGDLIVETLGSGMECGVHAVLDVDGNTVDVAEFSVTTDSCSGFGAMFEGCQVVGDEATVPWPAIVNEDHLEVEVADIHLTLDNCMTPELNLTLRKKRFYLVNYTKQTKPIYNGLEFGATGNAHTSFGELSIEASGTLEFVGAAPGTYEIA